MTVIRPNSISGITSITAQANEINFFRSNGTLAGLQINGVNFNTTSGISTLAALNVTGNVSIAGTLTYEDVTNVDSVGVITARSTIDAQGDVSIADSIVHTGDTNTKIRFPAADTVTVETAGSERIRITSDGKVGINSATPNTRLDVIQTSAGRTWTPGSSVVSMFERSGNCKITMVAGSSSHSSIDFGDTSNDNAGYIRYDHSDNSMSFRTNGNVIEKLIIASDGRVTTSTTGVISQDFGTTSSTGAYLHFDLGANGANIGYMGAGNQLITGATTADLGIRAGANFVISTGGTTERLRIATDGIITQSATHPQIILKDPSNRQVSLRAPSSSNLAALGTDSGHDLIFYTNGYSNERLRIDSNGTSTFKEKFKVDYQVSGNDYCAYFRNQNANSYGVWIQEPASVNVGYPLLAISNSSGGSHFRVDSGGLVYANSGTGTEKPAYFCRAWANLSGDSTPATIRVSKGIGGFNDLGVGDYRFTFSSALPDANYSAICSSAGDGGWSMVPHIYSHSDMTTTTVRFSINAVNMSGQNYDRDIFCMAIFR